MSGVREFDRAKLRVLPADPALAPHPTYLEARRQIARASNAPDAPRRA